MLNRLKLYNFSRCNIKTYSNNFSIGHNSDFLKKERKKEKYFQHFKSSYKFCSFLFTFIHSAWNPLDLRSFSKIRGFAGGSDSKESVCNVRDLGSIPGLGRSHGEGNSYPLQYSGLEYSMDRRAWQATVHGVAKSQT